MPILIQILLGVVIVLSSFLITFAAIQVYHIFSEFRRVLQKLNRVLDNTQTLSDTAARPVAAVNQFFSEVKTLVDQTEDQIVDSTPDRVITVPKSNQTNRRFFRRGGQFLRPS